MSYQHYDTANNPADLATCCMSPDKLMESRWLLGPEFLLNVLPQPHDVPQKILLDKNDPEVKWEVVVYTPKSQVQQNMGCSRLQVGLQSSPWVTLRRCEGTPNWYGPTRIGHNANEDRTFSANTRAIGDAHGRSYWNRQQPPHCNNTFWHRRNTAPNPCHATYYEDPPTCPNTWSIRLTRPLWA